MYKLKLTILQQGILRFLSLNAGLSFNARRLSQRLEVSQTAIAKSLPLLERERLIKIEKDKESGRLAIELNRENPEGNSIQEIRKFKTSLRIRIDKFLKTKIPQL